MAVQPARCSQCSVGEVSCRQREETLVWLYLLTTVRPATVLYWSIKVLLDQNHEKLNCRQKPLLRGPFAFTS